MVDSIKCCRGEFISPQTEYTGLASRNPFSRAQTTTKMQEVSKNVWLRPPFSCYHFLSATSCLWNRTASRSPRRLAIDDGATKWNSRTNKHQYLIHNQLLLKKVQSVDEGCVLSAQVMLRNKSMYKKHSRTLVTRSTTYVKVELDCQ